MENTSTPVTTTSVGLRYGLLTGLATIIISFGLNMARLDQSPAKWITSLVLVGAIFLAQKHYKEHNGGFMSYGQGLGIGAILSAVAGVLGAVGSYIYVTFIDNTFIAHVMDTAREEMEAKGTMSDEQVDQAMAMSAKFMTGPMMVVFIIIGTLLMGFLASLIISAITKNTRPEFE